MTDLKFLNDILQPWEKLNTLLSQPYALQPNLSAFTREIDTLSVSIAHWGETKSKRRKKFSLFNNIADTAKHTNLNDEKRETTTNFSSFFLCNGNNEFRFLRNVPYITYEKDPAFSGPQYDFMQESLIEIKEIMRKEKIYLDRDIIISEHSDNTYYERAKLKFDEKYCININSLKISFFIRVDGELVPYEPPEVKLTIY